MLTDKLNQFVANLNGQFVEVSYKDAIYQCMDLAYLWIFCLDYPKTTIQHQYAYEVFTKPTDLTYKYFDLIPNTPEFIPQDGDICVFKGGTAGHIAICLGGGTTSKFWRFEQNNPLGANASLNERGYTNMLGVLRPKVFTSTGLLMYRGYDIHNDESNMVAIDKMIDLIEGRYIAKDEYNKIINELDSKSTEQATQYANEKQILEEKIKAQDTALFELQNAEHTWQDTADDKQRKLQAVVDFITSQGIPLSTETDITGLVAALSKATKSDEINNLYTSLSSRLILSEHSPTGVLEALDGLEKVYNQKIEALKIKQPSLWQFIINKYFK